MTEWFAFPPCESMANGLPPPCTRFFVALGWDRWPHRCSAMMGGVVIKIESLLRPDGARRGHAGFHDLLNARKRSIAVRF